MRRRTVFVDSAPGALLAGFTDMLNIRGHFFSVAPELAAIPPALVSVTSPKINNPVFRMYISPQVFW